MEDQGFVVYEENGSKQISRPSIMVY